MLHAYETIRFGKEQIIQINICGSFMTTCLSKNALIKHIWQEDTSL